MPFDPLLAAICVSSSSSILVAVKVIVLLDDSWGWYTNTTLGLELHSVDDLAVLNESLSRIEDNLADTASFVLLVLNVRLWRPHNTQVYCGCWQLLFLSCPLLLFYHLLFRLLQTLDPIHLLQPGHLLLQVFTSLPLLLLQVLHLGFLGPRLLPLVPQVPCRDWRVSIFTE